MLLVVNRIPRTFIYCRCRNHVQYASLVFKKKQPKKFLSRRGNIVGTRKDNNDVVIFLNLYRTDKKTLSKVHNICPKSIDTKLK